MPSLEERLDFLTVFDDRLDILQFGHHTSRVKTPYPRPVASGQDLEFNELLNGTYRFQLASHLTRYNTDDVIRDRAIDGSMGPFDLLDTSVESSEALFKELAKHPYYTLYRRGGCTLCDAPVIPENLVMDGNSPQFVISTTSTIGQALYQDDSVAGVLLWADGTYHFYDMIAKTLDVVFTGVNLDKIYLFDKTAIGSDTSGNIYLVNLTGLTPLGRDGDFAVFDNRWVVIQTTDFDDGSVSRTELYDITSGLIEVVGDFFPMIVPKLFTQNYYGNKQTQDDQTKEWAVSTTQVATVKIDPDTLDVTAPVTDGDGRFIHAGLVSYMYRDYMKRKSECGAEKVFTAYTFRYPCTDIFMEVGSGVFYYTMNYKEYFATGLTLNAPISRVHRMRTIRAIGFHEVDVTYNGDNYNPTTQATINLNVQLLLY